MFHNRAKSLNRIYSISIKTFWIVFAIVFSILFILQTAGIIMIVPKSLFVNNNGNPWLNFLTNVLFFGIITSGTSLIFLVISFFIKWKCVHLYIYDCYEIVYKTKLPKKLPKVIYVYTTHNDLIESRVLENRKQTYRNFMMYVADGSDNEEQQERIRKFCAKNNIKLIQMPLASGGSKNKADNLNFFIKHCKEKYDYIMTGDADVAINPRFVEHAIKFFSCKKIKNLGFVSSLSYNYRSKGVFTNSIRYAESAYIYSNFLERNYKPYLVGALTGQVCLIKKEALKSANGRFPDSVVEDWYLEAACVENNQFGIMIPTSICYNEFDTNIEAYYKRTLRVFDWIVKWWKDNIFKINFKYNYNFDKWYSLFLKLALFFILFASSILITSIVIWLVVNYWDVAFNGNYLFYVFVGIILASIVISIAYFLVNVAIISDNKKDAILFPIIVIPWLLATSLRMSFNWLKCIFLNKYFTFGGSGKSRNSVFKNKKILLWWVWMIIIGAIIGAFNYCIFTFVANIGYGLIGVIIFDTIFGYIFMAIVSYLILWYVNKLGQKNNFSRQNPLLFNNPKHNFDKIRLAVMRKSI